MVARQASQLPSRSTTVTEVHATFVPATGAEGIRSSNRSAKQPSNLSGKPTKTGRPWRVQCGTGHENFVDLNGLYRQGGSDGSKPLGKPCLLSPRTLDGPPGGSSRLVNALPQTSMLVLECVKHYNTRGDTSHVPCYSRTDRRHHSDVLTCT
jgi:hypothetical protein